MKSWLRDTATGIELFMMLVDRRENGTPAGSGWGTYEVVCEWCCRQYLYVAMVGTKGKICPGCGATDDDFVWLDSFDGCGGDGSQLVPVGFEFHRLCAGSALN